MDHDLSVDLSLLPSRQPYTPPAATLALPWLPLPFSAPALHPHLNLHSRTRTPTRAAGHHVWRRGREVQQQALLLRRGGRIEQVEPMHLARTSLSSMIKQMTLLCRSARQGHLLACALWCAQTCTARLVHTRSPPSSQVARQSLSLRHCAYRLDCTGKDACNSVDLNCPEDPSLCSVVCSEGEPACNSLTVRAYTPDGDEIVHLYSMIWQ